MVMLVMLGARCQVAAGHAPVAYQVMEGAVHYLEPEWLVPWY